MKAAPTPHPKSKSLAVSTRVFSILVFALLGFSSLQSSAEDSPPNVIFILTDDQGSADLGCYGACESLGYLPHSNRIVRASGTVTARWRFTDTTD